MISHVRWALIHSCGALATLAVGPGVDGVATLDGREFSARWPQALRELLRAADMQIQDLDLIGVVNGPGSFTGVRVGLAAAKGLCEGLGAKLIVMSRLEVLQACGGGAVAVIDAGRGEWYVRDGAVEKMVPQPEMAELKGRRVITLRESEPLLAALGLDAVGHSLNAHSGMALLLKRWQDGMLDDPATVDANYVKPESAMYASGRTR